MSTNRPTQMQIRNEIPATRCEICHQSDQFNSINNICMRCLDMGPLTNPIDARFKEQVKIELSGIDLIERSSEISPGIRSGLIINFLVVIPAIKLFFDQDIPIITLAVLLAVPCAIFGLLISIVNNYYLSNISKERLSIPQEARRHWLICSLRSFVTGALTVVALLPFYNFIMLFADGPLFISRAFLFYTFAIMVVTGICGSLISTINAFFLIRSKIDQRQ